MPRPPAGLGGRQGERQLRVDVKGPLARPPEGEQVMEQPKARINHPAQTAGEAGMVEENIKGAAGPIRPDDQVGVNSAEPVPRIMTTPSANPFEDPDLELKNAIDGQLAVRKFSRIPIGKPKKSWWFRVHPEFPRLVRGILSDELDTSAGLNGRAYVVGNSIAEQFERLVTPCAVYVYITRQGTPGVWLIPTRDSEGRQNDSWISQEKAAALARTRWIAMEWNQGTRSYAIAESPTDLGPPQFPAYLPTINDYLVLAFGERGIIKSLEDPEHRKIIEELLKVRR